MTRRTVQAVSPKIFELLGGNRLPDENDERVNAVIPKAEELMKAAGKKYEPVIYKGAGHGFMRSGEPNNPNVREGDKKARDDAWARWKTLLGQL